MRLFLSYHTPDGDKALRLREALLRRRPGLEIFRADESLVAGDVWQQKLIDELSAADAVLLLLGRKLGPWQEREYQEAQRLQLLAGRAGRPRIIPVALTPDAPLPPFAALYHQITAPHPDADDALDAILAVSDATEATDATPDWRRINPYKGLAALAAADAAFFFGREKETAKVLERIRERPGKVLTLVGNSGVGKSSLVQAGVIDALRTQRWPGTGEHERDQWIGGLTDSHRWPVITFRPGETPVLNLAFAFLGLALEPSAALEKEATEWTGLLLGGTPLERLTLHVGNLLTQRTGEPSPRRYLVSIDQGEELYARSVSEQRTRFSSLIAEAAARPEVQVLSSLRADYYGRLQDDPVLFAGTERLDLLPMSASQLTRAISEPARRLGAGFEPAEAPTRLAELAAPQPGALPLLSDLLADLWREMEQRDDGKLNWSQRTDFVDVGRPLSARADRYLAENPTCRETTRALFTLRLAHVPPQGEPVRRRALRSECSEAQWRIVERLSDEEWRLLTMSQDSISHEPTVEVAHEQLLRSWTTLSDWLKESREFLVWKATLEQARRDWLAAGKADDALLMGLNLARATFYRNDHLGDLVTEEIAFIDASEMREQRRAQKERESEAERLSLIAARQEQEDARQKAEAARLVEEAARQKAESDAIRDRTSAARRLRAGVVLGLVVVGMLSLFAWDRYQAAGTSYAAANREAKRASETQSRYMSQMAQVALQRGDYGTALALAVEALPRTAATEDLPNVSAAERVLREVMQSDVRELHVLRIGRILTAAFLPNDAWVLTAKSDGAVLLWEASSGTELAVLRGHDGPVLSAAFSPDGVRALTASADRTARLWEASSGKELAVLRGHDGPVSSVVFSPDGVRALTASEDRTARLWEASSGTELAVLRGHDGPVSSAVFSPDGARVLTASADGTVRLWEAPSGAELVVLRERVLSAVFAPDGALLLTASADGTARLWKASSGKEMGVLRGHDRPVSSAVFSPDGARVLTASEDKTVRLWETSSGRVLAVLRGHDGPVSSAVFSPDGARVLTESADGTARLWEAPPSSTELVVLRGDDERVLSAVFAPDGARVLTASADGTGRLWKGSRDKAPALPGWTDGTTRRQKVSSSMELVVLRGHDGPVSSAVFSPDGALLLTASEDGTARLWESPSGEELDVLRHDGPVSSAVFSPDGARLLTASADRTARLWEASSGTELAVLRGHDGPVSSAVFSPDGARVLTASEDRTARLWEASSSTELAVLRGHDGPVSSAVFSPDGARVLTASADGTARLWEASSGKEVAVLRHGGPVSSVVFSPDGARLLTASEDRTARLWEASSGKELAVLRGHDGPVSSAVFSPDGARLLTASHDKTARLWEASNGTEMAVLRGHDGLVSSAVFSPDGTLVLTRSADKTARGWEASSGEELAILRHDEWVLSTAFSRDGARPQTAPDDKKARPWQVYHRQELQKLIDAACNAKPRRLSRAQRREFFLGDEPEHWPCNKPLDMKDELRVRDVEPGR